MRLRPPSITRTDTLFTYTTLFRSPRPDWLNIGPGHEALGDLRIVFPFEKNARGGEAIGELREPVHRWQIGDVVGNDERLDLLARGQGRSIARVVIAIAISFIHLADLAIADIARALLGGVQIGCRKDEQIGRAHV